MLAVTTTLPETMTQRSVWRVMTMSGLLAIALCALLEIWRPAFFFTHDNVTQWMPPMVEMARRMQGRQPPLISDSLYGGNYDWSHDASVFPLISPLLPVLSPIAMTSSYFLLVDAITIFELFVVTISFAGAAGWLRQRHRLAIPDHIIVAASLSFAFAPLPLLFSATWMGFINAQAGWPLVYVALQFRSATKSIGLIALAFIFSVFGGNLHPFSFLALGSFGWALYFSVRDRSLRPVLCLMAGFLVLLAVVYLVLGPGIAYIAETGRIRIFSVEKSSRFFVTPVGLVASALLGPFTASVIPPSLTGDGMFFSSSMAYSAVSLPVAVALLRGAWRDPRARSVLAALVIVGIFIWRPRVLGELVAVLPMLRSTRWPFREVDVLLFHIHLLFLLTYRPLSRIWNQTVWLVALIPMVWLIAGGAPPTPPLDLSRRLLMTGTADAYWNAMRPRLGPAKSIVCMEVGLVDNLPEEIPFPLLLSHNFPAIFGIVSVSGYSSSSPLLLEQGRMMPPDVHGIYTPAQAKIYLERFPGTRLTVLRSIGPPIWSIVEDGRELRLTLDVDTLQIRELPNP